MKDVNSRYDMLIQLGIYELRGLARGVGVPSPTTKKRDELIKLIMERFESGNMERDYSSKQGRPCKELASVDALIDVFKSSDSEDYSKNKTFSFEDFLVLAQDEPEVFEFKGEEEYNMMGVIRGSKKQYYFKDLNDLSATVFVPQEHIKSYRIRIGDLVRCRTKKVKGENYYTIIELESINGVLLKDFGPRPIMQDEVSKIIPKNRITALGIEDIYEGGRYHNTYTDSSEIIKSIQSSINNLAKSGYRVVFLALNVPYEIKISLEENPNGDKFITTYEQSGEDGFNMALDAISYSESLQKDGYKVAVIALDVVGMLNVLDMYFSREETNYVLGHIDKSIIIIKKLMSIANAKKDGTSVTVFTSLFSGDLSDLVLRNEVLKISRNIE